MWTATTPTDRLEPRPASGQGEPGLFSTMPKKPNYGFEKRRKEQERQKKTEAKREEKLRRKEEERAATRDETPIIPNDADGR